MGATIVAEVCGGTICTAADVIIAVASPLVTTSRSTTRSRVSSPTRCRLSSDRSRPSALALRHSLPHWWPNSTTLNRPASIPSPAQHRRRGTPRDRGGPQRCRQHADHGPHQSRSERWHQCLPLGVRRHHPHLVRPVLHLRPVRYLKVCILVLQLGRLATRRGEGAANNKSAKAQHAQAASSSKHTAQKKRNCK